VGSPRKGIDRPAPAGKDTDVLKAIPHTDAAPRAVTCDVAAHARLRVPWPGVADLRRQPVPLPDGGPAAALVKHADEQTTVALAALAHAVRDHGLDGTDFSAWGVLAGPRYPGRAALVPALARFRAEGAWGMSPHLIPHRSLHSPSGTVSHALKTHGPNFGVAGSPGSASELLLNAAALLASGQVPALWVLLSRVEPEGELDAGGNYLAPAHVEAAALALTGQPGRHRLTLTVVGPDPGCVLRTGHGAPPRDFGLPELLALLDEAGATGAARGVLPDGGYVEARRAEGRR
jgi:hypothetical protein